MRLVRLDRFGQLEPGPSAAAVPEVLPGVTLGKLFLMSVAAGVTVWMITKLMERGSR